MGICRQCNRETNNNESICINCANKSSAPTGGFSLSGLLGKNSNNNGATSSQVSSQSGPQGAPQQTQPQSVPQNFVAQQPPQTPPQARPQSPPQEALQNMAAQRPMQSPSQAAPQSPAQPPAQPVVTSVPKPPQVAQPTPQVSVEPTPSVAQPTMQQPVTPVTTPPVEQPSITQATQEGIEQKPVSTIPKLNNEPVATATSEPTQEELEKPVVPAEPVEPMVQPEQKAEPVKTFETPVIPEVMAVNPTATPLKLENPMDIGAFGFDDEEKSASYAYKKAVAQVSGTEQKEVAEKVFTSDVTGFGDDDLEIAVLAGMMKDSFILDNLKGQGLMSGLFSTRFSRAIYQSVLTLREENPELSSLDKIILRNKMRQMNLYNQSVQDLIDRIMEEPPPALDQAIHYLSLMKEQALKRKLKEVSQDINSFIEKPEDHGSHNIETFTNKIIHDVRNIQKARTTRRINLVKEEMQEIIQDMERREREGEIDVIGYSFEPMHYLCQAISGFRKGFMYAIAGAPRRGKTTFTLELATRVATLNNIPVLFFTYEQTKKNLTYRLLAKESRLNPDTLQRKKIYSDIIAEAKFAGGWQKMQEYMDYFYIVEATKEDTVDRIRSYAYNAMQDFNTDDVMIFIDYLQKMPLSRDYNDEKFKVEEISTELKALTIELNNPIMMVSSLSKEGCLIDAMETSDERPTMYHCKGSGDLEYDLDCAMIQAKDWGDTKELFEQMQQRAEQLGKDTVRIPKVDVVNLYLDKNRDAPEGIFSVIQYLFFIEDNKFVELGPKYEDDRYRFGRIEKLIDKLLEDNFIVFFDKPKDEAGTRGRVTIQLKDF